MEQARRQRIEEEAFVPSAIAASLDPVPAASSPENIVRLAIPGKPEDAEERAQPGFLTARDFAAALDAVHDAAQAMRSAEGRAREADTRTQTLAQRATEELKNAELRILAAEGRVRAAEARAEEAEKRAREADSWLRQILATINEELPARKPA